MRPFSRFRNKSSKDFVSLELPRPQLGLEAENSVSSDLLKAQQETLAEDWGNIGPPVPPTQRPTGYGREDLTSRGNYEVLKQIPTYLDKSTRPPESPIEYSGRPDYARASSASSPHPQLPPNFAGNPSIGSTLPPTKKWPSSIAESSPINADLGKSDQSTPQLKIPAKESLLSDISTARKIVSRTDWESCGPPVPPYNLRNDQETGSKVNHEVFRQTPIYPSEQSSKPKTFPDYSGVNAAPAPPPKPSLSATPTIPTSTHAPLKAVQQMSDEINDLLSQTIDWSVVGKPVPPRFPMSSDED